MLQRTLLPLAAFAVASMSAPLSAPLSAQGSAPANLQARTTAAAPLARALPDDSLLVRSLVFRNIGPAVMSGRIIDIAVPSEPKSARGSRLGTTAYVAVATSGIWKTTNGGITWTPITDSLAVGSVGAVAVAPSNGDIVWVGSGEAQNMRSSSWGIGVFKSMDGGRTWSKPMLPNTQHIGRIVIDPRDPNVVHVASVGPLWAPGGDRGLFRTADGGATWTNVLSVSAQTGVTEVVFDPKNPDVLYAATLQRERRAYGFLPGGPESAIYKSTNNGRTWTKLTNGLPTGEIGRIGLSVCASQPNTVYSVIHAKPETNGVYRSDDAGATWRKVNNNNGTAWFYGQIRCDPTNPEHIVRLNVGSQESFDGGRTWTNFGGSGVHSDHHALWINPEAPEHMIMGNDGGLDITYDGGRTWQFVENINGAQFYAISVDDAKPFYNVYGGLQDNATWGAPNRTRSTFGPTNADWWRMAGGDGFYNIADPFDNNIVYAESQEGNIVRHDARIGQNKSIRPIPKPGERHRYNWSAPIVPSRHRAGTVYFAANHVFKSIDRGDTWETISGDLTGNYDRDKLPMRGAIPSKDALGLHEGTALFGNISTMDESPRRPGLLVVGTDDGVISVTRDDGKTWTKSTTFPGVPDTTYVSRTILSAHADGTIYATLDGHRSNDFKPYVLKSTDFGRTWTSIAGNLPAGGSVQVIREHHRQPNLLFVGTEFGVFFTIDGGTKWTQLKSGMMAGVPVWDLALQRTWNDLVVGTHGRGIYILDDITPLEKLAEAKRAPVAYLFPIRNEMNMQPNTSRQSGMGSSGFAGQNPPSGVIITYLMNDVAPTSRASLEIVDAAGAVVRALPVNRLSGMFRTTWDMRVGAPLTAPLDTNALNAGGRGGAGGGRGGGGGGGGFGQFGGNAPVSFQALPGAYTARLRITPQSGTPTLLEQRFTLTKDPLVALTDLQLKALYDYRLGVARFQRTLVQGNASIDSVFNRFQAVRRALQADSSKATPAVKAQVESIEKAFAELSRSWGSTPAQRVVALQARQGRPQDDDDEGGAPVTTETIQDRAGRLGTVMNVSFAASPWQVASLRALPAEATTTITKLRAIEQQVAALERAVPR